MRIEEIEKRLEEVARLYPEKFVQGQLADVKRQAFNLSLAIADDDPAGKSIADIGGGIGLFSTGAKGIGFERSVLIDDFGDPVNLQNGNELFSPHRKLGVEVFSRDAIRDGLGVDGEFDIITSFDSMEHWHSSPKKLFGEAVSKLKPNGRLVIGVPNAINARKRVTTPLGIGSWSSMDDWYEQENFRGHVREPSVDDLRYIARDLGLRNVEIIGRNWTGYANPRAIVRTITAVADRALRVFPALCGDIYLIGYKG